MKPDAFPRFLLFAAITAVLAAGCGDDNGATPAPATNTPARTAAPTVTATVALPRNTATPTLAPLPPTNTPTAQSTATATVALPTAFPSPTATGGAGGVTGLFVLSRNVSVSSSDALGSPPQQWAESADAKAFDRSLAAADWSIDGGIQGVTGPDGRFAVGALPAGPHTLQISKTLDGNLASASIPFTVGDNGSADLIVEVSWGQVRSIATYTQGGVEMREVRAPNGSWIILRAGRISSFGDWGRTLVDTNGDGTFEVTPCLDSTGSTPPASAEPCDAGQACNPGERCVCVPSCPGCDDCPKSVCVPDCVPVDITRIDISGPSQLVVGQQGSMVATLELSDGSTFDVTYLVDWTSSDTTVATADSWGTVTALQIGSTSIAAALGALTSDPWPLQVTGRPALRKIDIQNVSCFFPMGAPTAGETLPADAVPSLRSDILPVPNCTQVVQIGGTIQFRAIGEFDNNYFQDITDEAQWQLTPPEVGSVVAGLFTAVEAGTAQLTASLEGVTSDATEIGVVTQPTVIGLTIYAENSGFPVVAKGGAAPVAVASGMPCLLAAPADASGAPCCCPGPLVSSDAPCRCTYSITALVGDQLRFHATAQYDTGEWKDVTNEVTWKSSDSSVASIDTGGVMKALQAGDTAITATLDTITSDPANVHVVDHATLQSIWIYQEGQPGPVVAKGDQRFLHAMGSYDIGISREITTDATWKSSDEAVGGFDTAGVFTGRAAGDVQVWAELEGVQSNQVSLEVFETSELSYCDPNNINRAVWSDDFNRVILESDCAWYSQPGLATLRYTVTEMQPHGGIFNPCLDLYVFAGQAKVRTIREEGCGDPFLAANAPGRDQEAVKYQLRAFWDLKDDSGNPVPPGTYTIYGRFYLYYDPVVSLKVKVLAPNEPTPTPQPTNGISPTTTPSPAPTSGGCELACDNRPCLAICPDGQTAKGTCSALTVDGGCECTADCGLVETPTPTPTSTPIPTGGLPDLWAWASLAPSRGCQVTPDPSGGARLQVCVGNGGTAPAGPFSVCVYSLAQFCTYNPMGTGACNPAQPFARFDGLAPGAMECVLDEYLSVNQGSLVVDSGGEVPESDETNNCSDFFVPAATPEPTCSPTVTLFVSPSPTPPTPTPTASAASEKTAVVIPGISAASISAGSYHACAVTNDGQAACWGRNDDGESAVPPGLGEVTQVSAGDLYTCAVTSAGTVACWGSNFSGKATPPNGLTSVTQVAAGGNHTCARRADGTVVCWGNDGYGQASPPEGLSDVAEVGVGSWFSCARTTPGDVVCWGSDSFSATEVPDDLGAVVQISVRGYHTCVRRADGSVRCWGFAGDVVASVPPDLSAAQQVTAGSTHDCVLDVAARVTCWGNDSYLQLQPPVDLGAVDQVSAGGVQTCARRVNGEVVCWGYPFNFPPSPTPTP